VLVAAKPQPRKPILRANYPGVSVTANLSTMAKSIGEKHEICWNYCLWHTVGDRRNSLGIPLNHGLERRLTMGKGRGEGPFTKVQQNNVRRETLKS